MDKLKAGIIGGERYGKEDFNPTDDVDVHIGLQCLSVV